MHMPTRSIVLVLAAALAAMLLLVIPVTSQAQQKPLDDNLTGQKRAILERETQRITAARTAPRPPKNQAKAPRMQRQSQSLPQRPNATPPLPHRSAGNGTIVESGLAPFPASMYTFENRWFQKTPAGDLVVYAGGSRDDPAQGVVAVRLIGASLGPATVYRTPMRSGPVRVTSAEGQRLNLVTSAGTPLVFDVASRTFGP
jgi:hypothetical protein